MAEERGWARSSLFLFISILDASWLVGWKERGAPDVTAGFHSWLGSTRRPPGKLLPGKTGGLEGNENSQQWEGNRKSQDAPNWPRVIMKYRTGSGVRLGICLPVRSPEAQQVCSGKRAVLLGGSEMKIKTSIQKPLYSGQLLSSSMW